MCYYRREPWGEWIGDNGRANIATLIANAFRGKHQAAAKVRDFLVVRQPRRPKTRKQWERVFEALGAMTGGG